MNEEHFPSASKKVVQRTLTMPTKHGCYLQAITQGGPRYHLDSSEEGEIILLQQQHATETLEKRQIAKG